MNHDGSCIEDCLVVRKGVDVLFLMECKTYLVAAKLLRAIQLPFMRRAVSSAHTIDSDTPTPLSSNGSVVHMILEFQSTSGLALPVCAENARSIPRSLAESLLRFAMLMCMSEWNWSCAKFGYIAQENNSSRTQLWQQQHRGSGVVKLHV